MTLAKLFTHGGSQAVRLPKEFRFEGREVHVRRVGVDVILSPQAPASMHSLIESLDQFEPGMRIERERPAADKRVAIRPRKR
jgi:antitoxin VapB